MSTVEIILNVRGSTEAKKINFIPSMVNSTIENSIIYFPPNFILSNEIILKVVKDSSSVMEILTDISMYEKLLLYYTDKARGYKLMGLEEETTKNIIKTNVDYMLKLWLNPTTKIFIDNKAYTIIESKLKSYEVIKKKPNFVIQMIVNIQVAKDNTYIGIKKIKCSEKRYNINKLFFKLFGKHLFTEREQTNKYSDTPPMYSTSNVRIPKYSIPKIEQPDSNSRMIQINNYYDRNNHQIPVQDQLGYINKVGGKKRTLKKRRFKRTRERRV